MSNQTVSTFLVSYSLLSTHGMSSIKEELMTIVFAVDKKEAEAKLRKKYEDEANAPQYSISVEYRVLVKYIEKAIM